MYEYFMEICIEKTQLGILYTRQCVCVCVCVLTCQLTVLGHTGNRRHNENLFVVISVTEHQIAVGGKEIVPCCVAHRSAGDDPVIIPAVLFGKEWVSRVHH